MTHGTIFGTGCVRLSRVSDHLPKWAVTYGSTLLASWLWVCHGTAPSWNEISTLTHSLHTREHKRTWTLCLSLHVDCGWAQHWECNSKAALPYCRAGKADLEMWIVGHQLVDDSQSPVQEFTGVGKLDDACLLRASCAVSFKPSKETTWRTTR